MDHAQLFWDAFRRRWRARLATWKLGGGAKVWTQFILAAAEEACQDYADRRGLAIEIGRERHGRLDVHAEHPDSGELVVAFESELAYWDYNGASGKDWREEFPKLCAKRADLRVLSSTIEPGTCVGFRTFLEERIDSMREAFLEGKPGAYCLIFGPESTPKDPNQPWMAFSLEPDLTLRELESRVPLRPWHVLRGADPATE